MAIRVLQYLEGTKHYGLIFDLEDALSYDGVCIESWSDSDWANDKRDRKSISGYVARINSQTISSKDRKQDIVTASSCHAEVVAANAAARDIVFLKQLFEECGLPTKKAKLIIENYGAEQLCNHPGNFKRSKHIETQNLIVRGWIEDGIIETKSTKSNDNIADCNTKILPEVAFKKSRMNLGIEDISKILVGQVNFIKENPELELYDWNANVCTCVWRKEYETM